MPAKRNNIFALSMGLLLSVLLLFSIEYFFRLNEVHHWLERKPFSFPEPKSRYSLDLDYLKDLTPYPGTQDFDDPDDYSDLYRFEDCKEGQIFLYPSWPASKNCRARITLKKSNSKRIVYDTYYTFDSHALRVVPAAKKGSEKFLVFLGCSFTLGEGVPDEATFANRITQGFKDYNAFNLGMGGYGPNSNLAVLELGKDDLRMQAIRGNSGIAVYTFIEDHFKRLIGTASWLRQIKESQRPYYYLKDGKLIRDGSFQSGRPIRTALYEWLGQSAFLRFFNLDFPPITEREFDLFVAVIKEMKHLLEKNYGVKQFIFAAFPAPSTSMEKLGPKLEKEGITVFDFSTFPAYDLSKGRNIIFGNGHPSELGHRIYSDLFLHEAKQRGILNGQ